MFLTKTNRCRFCNSKIEILKQIQNLYSCGIFPESRDTFVDFGDLEIGICTECQLIQLLEDYDHRKLYTENYGYRSSLNESMVKHLSDLAEEIIELIATKRSNQPVHHLDIGSNDATLLNQVRDIGIRIGLNINQIGVDPSGEGFRKQYLNSILIAEPFNFNLSKRFQSKFKIISSIAMFYDLPDPKNFVRGIKEVLAHDGVWISEQSYVYRMFEQNAFDTICQEHLEYYSITDIMNLCASSELEVFDVKFNDVNGGSFRFYVQHIGGPHVISIEVQKSLELENQRNKRMEFIHMFNEVEKIKLELRDFLFKCKKNRLEVHGYGASTKGNTLLQYFDIGSDLLSCIAERNELKFGKYTPGTTIPIVSEEESKSRNPDVYLVLPWHFKESILERESKFRESTSTKFVFPLPNLQVF